MSYAGLNTSSNGQKGSPNEGKDEIPILVCSSIASLSAGGLSDDRNHRTIGSRCYTYDPFDNTTVSGSTSANALQFTGRENDLTGLYFYRARYYSPTLQRFVSQDPIGFLGGVNLYTYTGNRPTEMRDRLGEDPITGGLLGIFIGGFSAFETAEANGGQNVGLAVASGVVAGAVAGAIGGLDPTDITAGTLAGAAGGAAANYFGQKFGNPCGGVNWGGVGGAALAGAAVGAGGSTLASGELAVGLGAGLVKGSISGALGPALGPLGGLIGGHL